VAIPAFKTSAAVYFACVLPWSAFWWLASPLLLPGKQPESSLVFLLGGAGPLLWAVAFTHLNETLDTQRDFWRRVVDPRLIAPRWLAIALLVHPAIVALAIGISVASGDMAPTLRLPANGVVGWLMLVFFTFWFGPLPEEMGWRGFALDRLLKTQSALSASIILGCVWATWHLPLFAVPGTFQHDLGIATPRGWVFLATMVPLSVVITWVYQHTARSTLAAALVHFSGNLTGALIVKSNRLAALELLVLCVVAALLVRSTGARRLSREAGDPGGTPATRGV
jgi:membrane protease YdiL (CAAX protease family)